MHEHDLLQSYQRKIIQPWLKWIFQERIGHFSGQLQYFKYKKGANKLVSNHSVPNYNLVNALSSWNNYHSWKHILYIAKPARPTSKALDSSVKRTNFMCVFMYFLDLSMHKRLCLGVIEGHLIILLIKAMLTRTRLAVGFAFFWQPRFFKKSLTCFSRHSIRALLFNRFIYRFDTDFKSPWSKRGFLLEGFFKNLATVTTWRIILSSIDLFVLNYAISFIIRAFSPSVRFFPILLDEL